MVNRFALLRISLFLLLEDVADTQIKHNSGFIKFLFIKKIFILNLWPSHPIFKFRATFCF